MKAKITEEFDRRFDEGEDIFDIADPVVVKRPKCPHQDWYAIVLRRHPDNVLVDDRSLVRAWTIVRSVHPELGPEDLAFRTLTEKEEFDSI
jgi:hypothetical protein